MAIPAITEIEETLNLLDDWEARYAFVIDMGRGLPLMAEELKTDALLVPGCTSRVWLLPRWQDEKLDLTMDSDALIVKGLLAILYAFYQGKTATEILSADLDGLFTRLHLEGQLSPNRRNGFFAVAGRIRALAGSI